VTFEPKRRKVSIPRLAPSTAYDAELASGEVIDLPFKDQQERPYRGKVIKILLGTPYAFDMVTFEIQQQ
jgi:hypothetical protein